MALTGYFCQPIGLEEVLMAIYPKEKCFTVSHDNYEIGKIARKWEWGKSLPYQSDDTKKFLYKLLVKE